MILRGRVPVAVAAHNRLQLVLRRNSSKLRPQIRIPRVPRRKRRRNTYCSSKLDAGRFSVGRQGWRPLLFRPMQHGVGIQPRRQKLYNRSVYSLYSLLLFLVLIGSAPWWLLQMWRHGKYRSGWGERLGRVPDRLLHHGADETIWVHAVSVGEVLAMTRVIERLKTELPGCRIVVSTTTDSGQKLARQRFGDDNVFYLPLDLPFAVRPFFQALRPKLLVLAESEFWPNLLRWARLSGAGVAVVNARISDRSFPGYRRYWSLLRPMMQNLDLFLAQSHEDARRLIQIGAPVERVHVSGNLKFEVKAPAKSAIVAA